MPSTSLTLAVRLRSRASTGHNACRRRLGARRLGGLHTQYRRNDRRAADIARGIFFGGFPIPRPNCAHIFHDERAEWEALGLAVSCFTVRQPARRRSPLGGGGRFSNLKNRSSGHEIP